MNTLEQLLVRVEAYNTRIRRQDTLPQTDETKNDLAVILSKRDTTRLALYLAQRKGDLEAYRKVVDGLTSADLENDADQV